MTEPIITHKCIIFPAVKKDIDYFIQLYQKYESAGWMSQGLSPEVMKNVILERMERGDIRIWLATTKQGRGSRSIGFLYLTDITKDSANVHGMVDEIFLKNLVKEMEIRYTYTEDCYNGFIDYCFNELGIERLGTTIKRNNTLAIRIDKKVGFKIDGVLRSIIKESEGKFSDVVVMSILKNERLKSNSGIKTDKVEQPLQEVRANG